jgi:hypothetical protein
MQEEGGALVTIATLSNVTPSKKEEEVNLIYVHKEEL